MTGSRLEVYTRVGPENGTLSACATGGSPVVTHLVHGLYTPTQLALATRTALAGSVGGLAGTITYSATTGKMTLAANAALDVTLYPGLAELLGWDATLTNTQNLVGTQIPQVWIGRYPGQVTRVTLASARKVGDSGPRRRRVLTLTSWKTWGIRLVVQASELTALRTTLSYALLGVPFRVWIDSSAVSTWGWSSWTGYRTVRLADRAEAAEDWQTRPHQTTAYLDLDCVEFSE